VLGKPPISWRLKSYHEKLTGYPEIICRHFLIADDSGMATPTNFA
jgi:hypothetical protein